MTTTIPSPISTPSSSTESESLYDVLQKVGVYNITTFMKRLGINPENVGSQGKNNNGQPPQQTSENMRKNAMELLRLMGLAEKEEYAALLEKICLQGKDMLGEMSKTTITAAPTF